MTDNHATTPHADIVADASRKLHTAITILQTIETQGVPDVKIELVKALLKPTEEALNIDEK